jgi:post-segregation antitoxin (ccd killing protein)
MNEPCEKDQKHSGNGHDVVNQIDGRSEALFLSGRAKLLQYGWMFGCMPKMQVCLPDDFYEQLKGIGVALNVSRILQEALVPHLEQLERLRLLGEALADFQAEFGSFDGTELDEQEAIDKQSAVRPKAKKKRQSAA